MVNYTLDELANFSRDEQKLINEVMGMEDQQPLLSPRKDTLNNILGYSKVYSVKSSVYLGKSGMILN